MTDPLPADLRAELERMVAETEGGYRGAWAAEQLAKYPKPAPVWHQTDDFHWHDCGPQYGDKPHPATAHETARDMDPEVTDD